ncbi:uncharacterized protein A1O9_06164 [Exophiala aquamarina CBS 119918]|uniref:Transcription factor domain-containing protein n=1 Tax=Exophiala aquamarina CBS 119918 TaxID=1182545 RepID=A0A072PG39_9EURO|nr:uncharacterized protein A1O9_06164 [Exophiala aquamarina CBS 119918]KEF58238.1 hypothetical protein A1O9_06164 [Exophiala aquamarina CBS 119918]
MEFQAVAGQRLVLNQDDSVTAYFDHFIKSDREGRLILVAYRDDMAQYFPFVVFPPSMSLEQLKAERPFLCMAIMMVACRHDIARRTAMIKRVREIVSQRTVVQAERSLDILQGLLVCLGWHHFQSQLGPSLASFVYLALTVMTDLGLNKQVVQSRFAKPQREYFAANGIMHVHAPRTLDERRAFLGCLYLTSIVSICARDIERIRYTKYADECCRSIAEAAETPTDLYLLELIKICRLSEKINQTVGPENWDMPSGLSSPVGASVTALHGELQSLKATIPPTLLENVFVADIVDLLLLHYHITETVLFEIALDNSIDSTQYGTYPVSRLTMLFACLTSTQHFFETFHRLSVTVYFDLPYSTWSLLTHQNVVLSKLSLFVGDGWEQTYVANTLDFFTILDTFTAKVEEAKIYAMQYCQQESETGYDRLLREIPVFFDSIAARIHEAKTVHQMIRTTQSQAPTPNITKTGATDTTLEFADEFGIQNNMLFEFLDDGFWQS